MAWSPHARKPPQQIFAPDDAAIHQRAIMGCLDELLAAAANHPAGNAGADQAVTSVAELLQAATRLSEASYTAPGWDELSFHQA